MIASILLLHDPELSSFQDLLVSALTLNHQNTVYGGLRVVPFQSKRLQSQIQPWIPFHGERTFQATTTRLFDAKTTTPTIPSVEEESIDTANQQQPPQPEILARRQTRGFDIDTALFCAGLAFDSYVEPPANSSRWERGVRHIDR
jgi:hypothetical protein